VTINNDAGLFSLRNWNEYNLNPLTRNNWRASLVPAAAVIPAPIAYIKVVAVKTPVVEFQEPFCSLLLGLFGEYVWATGSLFLFGAQCFLFCKRCWFCAKHFYFEKIRVFKAGCLQLEYLSME
jgi:hypothetical protein